MAEAAFTAFTVSWQLIDFNEVSLLHSLQNQLSDSFAANNRMIMLWIGIYQQHLQLASITTIDKARRVKARHTVV